MASIDSNGIPQGGPNAARLAALLRQARRHMRADSEIANLVCTRDLATLRLKLMAGTSVDEGTTANGATPLMFAASLGFPDACSLLLEYGADINARNDRTPSGQQNTPLHFAVSNRHIPVVQLLVSQGAMTHMPNRAGVLGSWS